MPQHQQNVEWLIKKVRHRFHDNRIEGAYLQINKGKPILFTIAKRNWEEVGMLSIYNFKDPVKYLNSYLSLKKSNNTDFSINFLAKKLDLKPITLIEIIKGKKKIKESLVSNFIEGLEIDGAEAMYFQAIVGRSNSSSDEKIKMYDLLMQELMPTSSQDHSSFKVENLDLFSHWIYMVILSMAKLSQFNISPTSIAQLLRNEVSSDLIEEAFNKLIELGLLEEDSEGKIVRKYYSHSTTTDMKLTSVHQYFSLVCDLAKDSIAISPLEREFQCFSFPMDKKNLPLAKEIIRKCRKQLARLSEEGEPNEVFQANLMVFPVTDSEKSIH